MRERKKFHLIKLETCDCLTTKINNENNKVWDKKKLRRVDFSSEINLFINY